MSDLGVVSPKKSPTVVPLKLYSLVLILLKTVGYIILVACFQPLYLKKNSIFVKIIKIKLQIAGATGKDSLWP